MAGKGRLQGGCSGGARPGTGPKKRKPGLTRTQKRLAKQAALTHAVDETGEAQHAAPAPATAPVSRRARPRPHQQQGKALWLLQLEQLLLPLWSPARPPPP